MLALEIEFLSGVCYATSERGLGIAEYPPQADRVFSALVATWAARGELLEERAALEWLERLQPPHISASPYFERSSVDVYVPVNDARTATKGDRSVLPTFRGRQPRRFPAAVPLDPVMRFVWSEEPDASTFNALSDLATDLSYVGHSASLVRARFHRTTGVADGAIITYRSPFAGRLAQLEAAYRRGDPTPRGDVVSRRPSAAREVPQRTVFDRNWIVLPGIATREGGGGDEADFIPDARASAFVSKRLRDAIMSTLGVDGHSVPEWVSGHQADGSPSLDPHLAIVPLLDVGHTYATGNLMGVAIVPPAGVQGSEHVLINALMRLRLRTSGAALPQIALQFHQGRWRLALTDDDERPSLSATRYLPVSGARRWATVTPIVLDRHPKARGAAARTQEIEEMIAVAATRIGLPRPAAVVSDPYSAFVGSPPARPSSGAPAWTGWSTPDSLGRRPLTHAVLAFDEPVPGPMLLGAGRFLGLGMCRPFGEDARRG